MFIGDPNDLFWGNPWSFRYTHNSRHFLFSFLVQTPSASGLYISDCSNTFQLFPRLFPVYPPYHKLSTNMLCPMHLLIAQGFSSCSQLGPCGFPQLSLVTFLDC